MEDCSDFLKKHIEDNNIKVLNRYFDTNIDLKNFVLDNTTYLNDSVSSINIFQRMYHWYYNLTSVPICEICGNKKNYKTFNTGYTCKPKCERQILFNKNITSYKTYTKEEIISNIEKLLETTLSTHLPKVVKNNYNELWFNILTNTNFLDDNCCLNERLYCIKNDIKECPTCKHCGTNKVNFHVNKNRYLDFCSVKCSASSTSTTDKRKKTSVEKFGEDNYMNREKAHDSLNNKLKDENFKKEYVDKIKQTKLERYGDENFTNAEKRQETEIEKYGKLFVQTKEFKEKAKDTKLERYGDENFVNVEQAQLTKLEKYGHINYNNYDKNKQTKLERYGDEQYNNSEKIKETKSNFTDEKNDSINLKRVNTNTERFGVEYPTQLEEVREKSIKTCLEKYGVESPLQTDKCIDNGRKKRFDEAYKNFSRFSHLVIPMFTLEEYKGNTRDHIYNWHCVKCDSDFTYRYNDGIVPRCLKCFPILNGTSNQEKDIIDYVKTLYSGEILTNTKKYISPLEIDVVIPDKKITIEFDGLYWHSELAGKDRKYHLHKTEMCEQIGFRLIHIFEDEWVNKQKIVKSKLKHLLGLTKYKIHGRKCVIKEIDNDLKNKFLNHYHIQGEDKSSVKLGAFYKNRLVAVMTFGKLRKALGQDHEDGSWELSRFATVSNFTIIGIFGKLMKHFENTYTPKKIITYADRRWSTGNLYEKNGFVLDHVSEPNYWYFGDGNITRIHRFNFRKNVLKDKLPIFDENLTEVENMFANGYNRIWDCGNLVFMKVY